MAGNFRGEMQTANLLVEPRPGPSRAEFDVAAREGVCYCMSAHVMLVGPQDSSSGYLTLDSAA